MNIRKVKVGKFSDIGCRIVSYLSLGIYMSQNSVATKFCHLALGNPEISSHLLLSPVTLLLLLHSIVV